MKFTSFASIATAAMLTISAPAFAQMGSSSMSNNSTSSDSSMSCQAMMDKAGTMSQPTDANKKMMASKEMDMAKAAMAKGQEKTCQMHMKKAMDNMM